MPPLGALFVAFFVVAIPAILLMSVWAGVTAFRILFPDDPLPLDPAARRRRRTARGESVPVRLRDIIEDERARQSVAGAERVVLRPGSPSPRTHPMFDDLWLRRN